MPKFALKYPFFIIMLCLVVALVGAVNVARMPVDLFPPINLPEVVVATFYSGMPPEDVETDITDPLERFFTLAAGVDHFESRSLLGVSIIPNLFIFVRKLSERMSARRHGTPALAPARGVLPAPAGDD